MFVMIYTADRCIFVYLPFYCSYCPCFYAAELLPIFVPMQQGFDVISLRSVCCNFMCIFFRFRTLSKWKGISCRFERVHGDLCCVKTFWSLFKAAKRLPSCGDFFRRGTGFSTRLADQCPGEPVHTCFLDIRFRLYFGKKKISLLMIGIIMDCAWTGIETAGAGIRHV